jgi:CheY-like chemotaxis protein
LYVEDDASLRALLADLLGQLGYIVDVAADGREGLGRVLETNRTWDLLLTDVRMPNLDGIQMVRRLRQSGSTIPAIVFTAFSNELIADELVGLGVFGVVEKGNITALVSLIERAITSEEDPGRAAYKTH